MGWCLVLKFRQSLNTVKCTNLQFTEGWRFKYGRTPRQSLSDPEAGTWHPDGSLTPTLSFGKSCLEGPSNLHLLSSHFSGIMKRGENTNQGRRTRLKMVYLWVSPSVVSPQASDFLMWKICMYIWGYMILRILSALAFFDSKWMKSQKETNFL